MGTQRALHAVEHVFARVLGLPVAFCLFGVVRWRIRRAARMGQKI